MAQNLPKYKQRFAYFRKYHYLCKKNDTMAKWWYNASEDEKRLVKMINAQNTDDELRLLLSFKDYHWLRTELWDMHNDNPLFVEMWIETCDGGNCHEPAPKIESIIFRPKYDNAKSIDLECFELTGYGKDVVALEFYELKSGESTIPIVSYSCGYAQRDDKRLHFQISKWSFGNELCKPKYKRNANIGFNYPYYLISESDVPRLLQAKHRQIIKGVTILYRGDYNFSHQKKINYYYSSKARCEAIKHLDNNNILEHLLSDDDPKICNAALNRLMAINQISKDLIYKMLESKDVNVRLKGINLLKKFDSN